MDELNFTNLVNIKLHEVFGLFASDVPGSGFKLGCLVASESIGKNCRANRDNRR